ncbi:ABC transporter ATP-binding protein, partial [Bacillus sp. AFS051223]
EATFQADSDAIDEILKTLLLYGVKKLEATPPTLEDLFMRHYQ